MIKQCPICKEMKDMRSNQKYCSKKCKKDYENSQRSARKVEKDRELAVIGSGSATPIKRPQGLNEVAGSYWDEIAPLVTKRGHLNILSAGAFAELCDLYSILQGLDGKDDNIKLRYSKQFLDYCKAFYLTPLSNRGNFGLPEKKEKEEDKGERFFKT